MPLNVQEPVVHDHTDGVLVILSRAQLANELHRSRQGASAGVTAFAWLLLSAVLWVMTFIGATFRNVGPVPDFAIRGVIAALAIPTLGLAIYYAWMRIKHRHHADPEKVVRNLTANDPVPLVDVLAKFAGTPDGSRRPARGAILKE